MMGRFARYFWIAVLLITVITVSCVRETYLKAGESHVVVDGFLSNDPVQNVRLFYTKGPSGKEPPLIEEAEVSLFDLTTGEHVGDYSRDAGKEIWSLAYNPVVGHLYRLEIQVPARGFMYAEQVMPGTGIRTIDLWYSDSMADMAFKKRYAEYGFRYAYVFNDNLSYHCWIYALNYNELTGKRELVEDICTDYSYTDIFNVTGELGSSLWTNTEIGIPDFLQDMPVHRRFLRIPKAQELTRDEDSFIVTGRFTGEYFGRQKEESENMGVLQVMTVSDEYNRYLREVMILSEQQESSDLADIFIRNNVYSNIHGGLGIWGARNVTSLRWHIYDYN